MRMTAKCPPYALLWQDITPGTKRREGGWITKRCNAALKIWRERYSLFEIRKCTIVFHSFKQIFQMTVSVDKRCFAIRICYLLLPSTCRVLCFPWCINSITSSNVGTIPLKMTVPSASKTFDVLQIGVRFFRAIPFHVPWLATFEALSAVHFSICECCSTKKYDQVWRVLLSEAPFEDTTSLLHVSLLQMSSPVR